MIKMTKRDLLMKTGLFLVLFLLIERLGLYRAVNWAYYQFGLSQLQSNFIFKLGELVLVLLLNFFVVKQKLFLKPHFTKSELAYWIFTILVCLPFFTTSNLTESLVTGEMGGVSEEFLARAVLMGFFMTYFLQDGYSRKAVLKAVLWSSLIFGVLHMTNITHMAVPYVVTQSAIAAVSGVAFGVIFLLTGNIWSAVAMHFAVDFILTAGDAISTPSTFQMYANQSFAAFKIILVIVAFFYIKKHVPALACRVMTN